MSRRRLDKLEGSLSPKEAVLLWLTEAHAYDSLPAYVAWLAEQPDASHPYVAIPARVEQAVFASMRGRRRRFVKRVMRESVGDTVFLLRLVIGLNGEFDDIVRTEELRHAALSWQARAIVARAEPRTSKASKSRWRGWDAAVGAFGGILLGSERARADAEARYLDGHDCLFPDLAERWRSLCAAADPLSDSEVDAEA